MLVYLSAMPEPTTTPKRLRIWTDSDGCSGCNYCGMDMEMDPFCAHPDVKAKHPYGLNISTAIQRFCGENDGETLKLWEKRQPR